MRKLQYLKDPKPTDFAACHYPAGGFQVAKVDPSDLHSAWYVVTPGGCMLTFNDCADDALDEARANWVAATLNAAARAQGAGEAVETEESIAADAYWNVAETMGTLDGYSVQEHVQTMHEVMKQCSDFLHDFVGSDEGGDDEAVKLAADVRNCLNGRIDLVRLSTDTIGEDHDA